MSLRVTPITLAEANEFVSRHHRHHKPTVGHIFSVAVSELRPAFCQACVDADGGPCRFCSDEGEEPVVCGVAIVGRPVARALQDGYTAEVLRTCTDGTPNACSMLYATCWRAAKALGYTKLGTYTMQHEPGTSLRAAGWKLVGESPGRSWDVPGRPRVTQQATLGPKFRWEAA